MLCVQMDFVRDVQPVYHAKATKDNKHRQRDLGHTLTNLMYKVEWFEQQLCLQTDT